MAESNDKLAKKTGKYSGWLSPFRNFFDSFFDDFYMKPFDFEFPEVRFPLMDLKDEKDKYILETEIPGLKKDEIDIEISKDRVVEIKGEKHEENEEKTEDGKYLHRERSSTSFYRRFYLPSEIDPEKVEAKTEDGLLKITFPKKDPEPAKKIDIK